MFGSCLRGARLLALVLACAISLSARAVEVTGLYEAVIPVANQGQAERNRATAEGLRQVLVKASGLRDVLALPAVAGELGRAETLLGSYRYESLPVRTATPGAPAATLLRLRLSYDPAGVLGILSRASAPVWGANRPQIYLWVAGEAAAPRTLYASGTNQADVLIDAAVQRGLPLLLPAAGEAAVLEDVTEGVPRAVLDQAGRTGAQAILAATVLPQAGKWRARGTLRLEGADATIEAVGGSEYAALRELIAVVGDRLGVRHAVVPRPDRVSTLRLVVGGVKVLADHAGLLRWLRTQPQVREANLLLVDGDQVEIDLTLAGDPATLQRAMQTDGRFASVDAAAAGAGGGVRIDATLRQP